MKKRYMLTVRGRTKEWGFEIHDDPRYIEEWLADGLYIDEMLNTVPQWAVDMGLTNIWIIIEDWIRT